jgi:hypothetical protein
MLDSDFGSNENSVLVVPNGKRRSAAGDTKGAALVLEGETLMIGGTRRPPQPGGITLLPYPGSRLRIPIAYLLIVAFVAISGCTPNEPVQKPAAPVAEPQPRQSPPDPKEVTDPLETKPALMKGSGEVAWAKELTGVFIAGLDGGLYVPYTPITIQRTQTALTDRGLYAGPVNGVLDLPTMKAIYAFQKATHILQLCGVPTPRTRRMLEQGSHTDPHPR